MSNRELTPVSYLVLGLIACGATTSYELKQRVANSVGFMWSFPHSALYAEPARLVDLGLLAEERELLSRRRRLYTITPAGRDELERWLREPTFEQPQLRDLGLLKLFFAGLVDRPDVQALADAQAEAHRTRLALYESIGEAKQQQLAEDPFALAALRMGLMVEQAKVAFWEQVAAEPPTLADQVEAPPAPSRAKNPG